MNEANEKLWAIHCLGPDTIIPQPNRELADSRCARQNAFLSELREKYQGNDYAPSIESFTCEVVEWKGSPEIHAAEVAEHGGDPEDWA